MRQDDLAGDAGAVDVMVGGYLAEDENEACGCGDFAGDVSARIVGDDLVQDGVTMWFRPYRGGLR